MRNTQEKFDLTLKAAKYNVSYKLPENFDLRPPDFYIFKVVTALSIN